MGKCVFLNISAYGHVNPTIAVVKELVSRGEQVTYFLTKDFSDVIEVTGATFRSYQSPFSNLQPRARTIQKNEKASATTFLSIVLESRLVLSQILEAIRMEKPDYVLYDSMCLWGHIITRVLQIPAILFHSSYVTTAEHFRARERQDSPFTPEMFSQIQTSVARLCATYHIPPIDMYQFFTHAEALNIVFLPRTFQPDHEAFDERFVFVGPSLLPHRDRESFPFERLTDQPVLYISLSTVINNHPDFLRLCFQAFSEQPWQVILSHGTQSDIAALGPAPSNFLLSSYVPQLEILQRASVFVNQGGINSVMESLYFGVPMVVIPQTMEHEVIAHSVTELGLGVTLDKKTLTATQLREAVTYVQQNPATSQCVRDMQQIVRATGGYKGAVDAILNFEQGLQRRP